MLNLKDLAELFHRHEDAVSARVTNFSLDGTPFDFNARPFIMGVINLSPDSWYRESVCLTPDQAIARGSILKAHGADLIDLGAESSLAQAARAGADLQKSKLLPVLKELRSARILVSVETYQPEVARASLQAGANLLNLTGIADSEEIFRAAADHEAAVIICYVEGKNVREVAEFDFTTDPFNRMRDYFARQIEIASRCHLTKIFIDPGLGFYYGNLQDSATRVRHQISVFLNTFRLRTLGFPVCQALPHAFEYFGDEVRSAEPFFAVLAALGKTDLFRTHEVPKIKAVLDTLQLWP
jgi:dihydropteroate synthase